MAKSYEISQSQLLEIEAARKKNRNKNVERRLCVLVMRAEGKSLEEISEKTGYHISTASKLIARYMRDGISAIAENHYKGNRRDMSFEEEAAILAPFIEIAERGEMVDIKEIAAAYQKAVPHKVRILVYSSSFSLLTPLKESGKWLRSC